MALPSGIARSPVLLGRYGWHSKNRDPVSGLCVRTSWFLVSLPSPASHGQISFNRTATPQLAPYCLLLLPSPRVSLLSRIPSGSDTLSPVTKDHMRVVVILSGLPLVSPLWLASPLLSGSLRRMAPLAFFTRYTIYSTITTRLGYPGSWYSTASLTWTTFCGAPIHWALGPCHTLPLSL